MRGEESKRAAWHDDEGEEGGVPAEVKVVGAGRVSRREREKGGRKKRRGGEESQEGRRKAGRGCPQTARQLVTRPPGETDGGPAISPLRALAAVWERQSRRATHRDTLGT